MIIKLSIFLLHDCTQMIYSKSIKVLHDKISRKGPWNSMTLTQFFFGLSLRIWHIVYIKMHVYDLFVMIQKVLTILIPWNDHNLHENVVRNKRKAIEGSKQNEKKSIEWGWNGESTRSAYYGHISLVIQRESEI